AGRAKILREPDGGGRQRRRPRDRAGARRAREAGPARPRSRGRTLQPEGLKAERIQMETKGLSADRASTPGLPALTTRPLSPALGAEIVGVDVSAPIDAGLAAQLQDIWHQSLVILLRDQKLSMEDQVRFAECFGPPATIHTPGHMAGHPAVML